MTSAGIKDLLNGFEDELKSLLPCDPDEDPDAWEPPSLERIKRKLSEQNGSHSL
jgi:hypothetical protein